MICPNCSYEDGWSSTQMEMVKGDEGEFLTLPIKLERERTYHGLNRRQLMGCPKCNAVFMED